jgi:hypothetical protein
VFVCLFDFQTPRRVQRTAPATLAAVKTALDKYKANHVTLVGHSLVRLVYVRL